MCVCVCVCVCFQMTKMYSPIHHYPFTYPFTYHFPYLCTQPSVLCYVFFVMCVVYCVLWLYTSHPGDIRCTTRNTCVLTYRLGLMSVRTDYIDLHLSSTDKAIEIHTLDLSLFVVVCLCLGLSFSTSYHALRFWNQRR